MHSADSSDLKSPGRADLWRQYEISIDEYRFQVELNWKRSQYYFVLNAAILVAAVGLLTSSADIADEVVGILFLLGAVVAGLALLANLTQNVYYRAARDQMNALAKRLRVEETSLKTTPGLGSGVKRLGKVTTFQLTMLGLIGLADLVGAAAAFCSAA